MKTRIDLMVSKWPLVPLKEVAEFKDNLRRPVKAADRKPGPFPYYGANGHQGTIDGYLFDEELVLLAEDGGYFAPTDPRPIAYRVEGKCWVNNHAHVLAPKAKVEGEYLAHVLAQYDISTFLTGSTRAKLTKSSAGQIQVPLPPLDEQRRIVDILNRAASIERLRAQATAHLRDLIPALFTKMFGDPIDNPMGWDAAEIGSVLAQKPNYGTMVKPSSEAGKWLDLRVANLNAFGLDLNSKKWVDLPLKDVERHSLRDGDIILARAIGSRSHLGKCDVVYPGEEDWALDSHLMRIRTDQQVVLPEYLVSLLRSPSGREIFLKNTRNSAVQFNINAKEFSALRIPIPQLDLQRKFVDTLQKIKAFGQTLDLSARTAREFGVTLSSTCFASRT